MYYDTSQIVLIPKLHISINEPDFVNMNKKEWKYQKLYIVFEFLFWYVGLKIEK